MATTTREVVNGLNADHCSTAYGFGIGRLRCYHKGRWSFKKKKVRRERQRDQKVCDLPPKQYKIRHNLP
jgi:hypothetical protein